MTDTVEILLSTYNGARFLPAFLQSLSAQDHGDWRLTVRDDGSSDGTLATLRQWRKDHPGRIDIVDNDPPVNLGALASFSLLLERSTARYVMFADQDDIWTPEKVRLTLAAMLDGEARVGKDCPILAHTDMTVVDDDLKVVRESFWRSQGLDPRRSTFSRLIVENIAWGCTEMLNRALVELVGDVPRVAADHDWWIVLVAAAFGEVVRVDRPTILYRRHGGNETELSDVAEASRRAMASPRAARQKLTALFESSRPRVGAFLERYGDRLTADQRSAMNAFLALPRMTPLQRRRALIRHRLYFTSWVRNLGMLLLI